MSPVPPAQSMIRSPGGGVRRAAMASFQSRCTPALIRSFMRSYRRATLSKTPRTRRGFSPGSTSRNPKVALWLIGDALRRLGPRAPAPPGLRSPPGACQAGPMPELPEVETVRRGLEPVLAGARLVRVEARRPDLRFPLPDGFVQRLTGASVLHLERRAKYLLAPLGVGDTLVMHLGMTGRFEIARPDGSERPGEFHYAPDPDPKH